MSDLDRLETFARDTTQQVIAPDFHALVTTARRRRGATYLTVGSTAAAVISFVAIGVQVVGDDQNQPVGPGPSTTHVSRSPATPTWSSETPPIAHSLSPQAIVNGATDGPAHLAVSTDDANVQATSWQVCATRICRRYLGAIAVTSDGFAHVHDIEIAPFADLRWLSGDVFVTQLPSGQLSSVTTDGQVNAIPITSGASPLLPGEVLFLEGGGQKPPGRRYLAVDSAGATAHPISLPLPSSSFISLSQETTQSLWGVAELDPSSLISSPDGGATWRAPYEPTRFSQLDPIDSVAPGIFAAVAAGDDDSRSAETLYRSTDAGASWQMIHPEQFKNSGAGWAVVLPEGQLLITVSSPYGNLSANQHLYESDSTDWQHFHLVRQTGGFPHGYLLTATIDSGGVTSLWLIGADTLLRSVDNGRTWTTARAR